MHLGVRAERRPEVDLAGRERRERGGRRLRHIDGRHDHLAGE